MTTIQEILSQNNVRIWEEGEHKNVRHGWIGVNCPWCGSGSEKAHLGISLSGTYAVCWQCGHHRIGDVLMRLTGKPWVEVKNWLDSLQTAPASRLLRPESPESVVYPPNLQTVRGPYRRYLKERGFESDEICSKWGVTATGPVGPLAWRLFIPIHLDGKVVSWTTRAIGDRAPKYRSAGEGEEMIPHKHLLYGMDYVQSSTIVVEGPLDAWAVGTGAVATLGLSNTQEQFDLISQMPSRVICFDSEPAAQRRARKLADQLAPFPGETHVVELETGSDPAEADQSEIEELRRKFL